MVSIRFTAIEVHDILNAEVARRHPELAGRQTEMCSICTDAEPGDVADGRFIGVDIELDADGADGFPVRQVPA